MMNKQKTMTMVNREVQENHTSFIKAPLIISGLLILAMLASVLLVNRVAIVGHTALEVIMQEHASDTWITVTVDGGDSTELVVSEEYETVEDEPLPDEWNFSREWTFAPGTTSENGEGESGIFEEGGSLDPILEGIFVFFLFLMTIITVIYLLGAMYTDRKDRSVLFWKSMPVSEWQDVVIKMGVAAILIPLLTVMVAAVTQMVTILLMMLLVWRLDFSPLDTVWNNIHLIDVMLRQTTALVGSAIWYAPFYAWLLLASAGAKRSPFALAVLPIIAIALIEEIFIGTEYIGQIIANHIPTIVVEGDAGQYTYGPTWSVSNVIEMVGCVAVAGGFMAAVVWLRRTRFEL